MVFESTVGLSGRAMVLGFFKCFFIIIRQWPTALAVGPGSAPLVIFSLVQTPSERQSDTS